MKKLFLHLRNLLLFLRALASIVRYGTRKNVPAHPPRKVLVVQLAKLGDMVCITPVLHALRKNLPGAKVYVLGDALNEQVLEHNTDFDEYVVFSKDKLPEIVRYLRREEIEVACLRGIGFIGLVTVLLSGIKTVVATEVVGGSGFETRTYRWLLPFVRTVEVRLGEYMPRQFLYLLQPLGISTGDTEKHLGFSEEANRKIEQFFNQNRIDAEKDFIVGVSPSAGNKVKEWPGERFAEVADYVAQKYGARVLLIGGPGDGEKVHNVIKNLREPEKVLNVQGALSIDELKALVSKLSLFISVDTGPIYIAEAFGVPTIDIVGPVDEREQPPQGFIHRNVVPERAKPVMSILNARAIDTEETRRQTLAVTTPMVIGEVDRLIQDLRGRGDL